MNSKDYFSFIRDFPHTLSVYLTFTLDQDVIDKIRENNSGRTIIIHDIRHGVTLKDNFESRLVCIPAIISDETSGFFHSKLVLLKGESNVRFMTGSMNLTRSSFVGVPQEVCFQRDLEYNSEELEKILGYINSISLPEGYQNDFIKEFRVNNPDAKISSRFTFISNRAAKISSYVKKSGENNPIMRIASPFIGRDMGEDFCEFLNDVQPSEVQFYTRCETFVPEKFLMVGFPVKVFRPLPLKSKNKFHAKLYSLDYGNHIELIIGSSNFTNQGFFRRSNERGNFECGVLLNITDANEIELIRKWFSKDWQQLVPLEKLNEGTSADTWDEETKDYVTATVISKVNGKRKVRVSIYCSDLIGKQISVNGHLCNDVPENGKAYSVEVLVNQNVNSIKGKIDSKEFETAIFSDEEFEEWRAYDGDSLFSYNSSDLESTDIKKLSRALTKEGIKVSTRMPEISEPPLLELFYHNVSRETSNIKRRKLFTESHFQELIKNIKNDEGGPGAYKVMQLIKVFRYCGNKYQLKNISDFIEVCYKQLEVCYPLEKESEEIKQFVENWAANGQD